MRGSRVKALRASFKATYGYEPAKTRRVEQPVRPKNWVQKLWWALRRHKPTQWLMYPSIWRRWKKLAQETDRAYIINPDKIRFKHEPNHARNKRRAAKRYQWTPAPLLPPVPPDAPMVTKFVPLAEFPIEEDYEL